jgi:F420-0:gamma-glutamyl ligase
MSTEASAGPRTEQRVAQWSRVRLGGTDYLRLPLHTRWLTEADDVVLALKEHLEVAQLGDTVAVSEKVVVLLTGRALDISTMQPGWLARQLAGHVRCRTDSKGLSVPEKMEYVVRAIGSGRVLAAAVAGAVTRPLGMRGTFYRLAGSVARDIDGGRPPYEHLLFPPLDTSAAQQICTDLEQALGIGVGIVDLNDFGGSIRAVSDKSLPAATLAAVLDDNPMGQRLRSTPFVIVRAADSRTAVPEPMPVTVA